MRVHAIQTGTVAVRRRQRAGRGRGQFRLVSTLLDRSWTEPLPIYLWAIEHPEGLIVVDTGETARAVEPGYFPRWHPYFRFGVRESVRPEEEVGSQLEALGLSARDVRWLVLTHLHTDHAGGLYHFPQAEIVLTHKEYATARGIPGRVRGYLPQHWPSWFAPRLIEFPANAYGSFPESLVLTEAGDVRLLSTPGHTPGHLSVVLEDGGGVLFFAGDASYTEQLMLDEAVDGVSPDVGTARETLRRIRRLAEARPVVYLPSHDPGSADRLVSRRPALAVPAAG